MAETGEVLKKLIEESGRSYTEIAEELGMSRQSLHQYVNREPNKIRVGNFEKILNALGYEIKIVPKFPGTHK